MAVILESRFEKADIMNAYINEIYLGQDGNRAMHGFGLASQFYFGKPLAELDLPEIALLVAIVRGPSYYDPRRHPERALERRNLVLRVLVEQEVVSAEDAERAAKKPLGVAEAGPQGRAATTRRSSTWCAASCAATTRSPTSPRPASPCSARSTRCCSRRPRRRSTGNSTGSTRPAAQAAHGPRGRGGRHDAADRRGGRAGRRPARRVRRLQPRARRQAPDRLARQAAGLPRRARDRAATRRSRSSQDEPLDLKLPSGDHWKPRELRQAAARLA